MDKPSPLDTLLALIVDVADDVDACLESAYRSDAKMAERARRTRERWQRLRGFAEGMRAQSVASDE